MGDSIERFPLFPLGLVLLPEEPQPLHIFEERYKTMVETCLESETEFGILWMGDHGLQEIGCTAEITQLLERAEDGRLNILVQGSRPFRLERRIDVVALDITGRLARLEALVQPKAGSSKAVLKLRQRLPTQTVWGNTGSDDG